MIVFQTATAGGSIIAQRVLYIPSLVMSTNSGIMPPENSMVNVTIAMM